VNGRSGDVVHTDRGDVSADLIVDALGWRRVLSTAEPVQPPEAYLSRGLEIHPGGRGEDLELWIDRGYVRAGYAWSFPADGELRVGVGSFEPRDRVKEPTVRLAGDLALPPVRYQGNWIPHRIRPATEDGVFFAGDSAGHCLPTTAEGIRTALYFGLECGRELRAVLAGQRPRAEALRRYHEFSAAHAWKFEALLKLQDLVPRVPPRLLRRVLDFVGWSPVTNWAFRNYLAIAPPPQPRAPAPVATRRPAAVAA
jgi:flavin-dependent dehydrogenase